jgi:mono/diheme cytochrome c family protein
MKHRMTLVAALVAVVVLGAIVWFVSTIRYGFAAHDEPTAMEAFLATRMRHWSVPAHLRAMRNPIPLTPEVLAKGRAHFADHCAMCHGNDGKGKTEMGQHLYPRAPDMTRAETQSLSDGEIFATIENGVRLSGMPGFGNGTAESAAATWPLVHFIRHVPKITPQEVKEMKAMNPVSPMEIQESKDEERKEEEFLQGNDQPTESHSHGKENR